MIPDGIRERFEYYRRWFNTFLIKEFLNLPIKYQERFLVLLQKFTEDCKKIHNENKRIKERIICIKVEKILSPDNKEESYIVCGKTDESDDGIKLLLPINKPKPKIGSNLYHTVFSMDEKIWYSSKEELITRTQT
jgi:hypothetical protein